MSIFKAWIWRQAAFTLNLMWWVWCMVHHAQWWICSCVMSRVCDHSQWLIIFCLICAKDHWFKIICQVRCGIIIRCLLKSRANVVSCELKCRWIQLKWSQPNQPNEPNQPNQPNLTQQLPQPSYQHPPINPSTLKDPKVPEEVHAGIDIAPERTCDQGSVYYTAWGWAGIEVLRICWNLKWLVWTNIYILYYIYIEREKNIYIYMYMEVLFKCFLLDLLYLYNVHFNCCS